MATIVLDIDDTMVPSLDVQIHCISQEHGKTYSVEDLRAVDYHWLKFSNMTADQLQEVFIRRQLLERVKFYEQARPMWEVCIADWKAAGHEVLFCTARDWHPNALEITKNLLGTAIWMRAPIFLVPHDHSRSKVERLHDIGVHPDVFVDDNPREIKAAADVGVPVVLRNNPFAGIHPIYMGETECFTDQQYRPDYILRAVNSHLKTLTRGWTRQAKLMDALHDRVNQTRDFMARVKRRQDSSANAVLADEWKLVEKFTKPVLVKHDSN